MTPAAFIAQIEAYYGKPYTKPVRDVIGSYLARYSDRELDALFEATILTYPGVYGKVPDVAIFERAKRDNPGVLESAQPISIRDGRVFHYDLMIGHMDDRRFIPDLSVLSQIERYRFLDNYTEYSDPSQYVKLLDHKGMVKK